MAASSIFFGIALLILAISIFINTIQGTRNKTQITQEMRQLTEDSVLLQLAGTLAAPHIRTDMNSIEQTDTINRFIPIAREVLRSYHLH